MFESLIDNPLKLVNGFAALWFFVIFYRASKTPYASNNSDLTKLMWGYPLMVWGIIMSSDNGTNNYAYLSIFLIISTEVYLLWAVPPKPLEPNPIIQYPDEKTQEMWYSTGKMINAGNLIQATENLNDIIRIMPNNYEALTCLASIIGSQGDTGRAIEYLQKAISIAPKYGQAFYYLGQSLLYSDREDEAEKNFYKAANYGGLTPTQWQQVRGRYLRNPTR